MFLQEFSSTVIQRNPKKVYEAAEKEPVVINRMANIGFVILTKEAYEKLIRNQK